jgi:hypothetical protein
MNFLLIPPSENAPVMLTPLCDFITKFLGSTYKELNSVLRSSGKKPRNSPPVDS